jgi:hypothetical protein
MRLVLVIVLLAGCGGSQRPEPPPPYTPANTPEAQTPCPQETAAADEARDRAIGEESIKLDDAAAEAVFGLAECERRTFDAIDLGAAGGDPSLIAELKDRFQSAKNLYVETSNYKVPRWVVGGHARLGDLYTSFGMKLRVFATPGEEDPDMAAMDERLKMDAGREYRAALDAAETWPALVADDEDVAAWVQGACKGVDRWQPGLSARYRVCRP